MKYWKKLVPDYAGKPVLSFFILQFLTYDVTMLLARNLHPICMETAWDRAVPFLPWTVLVYVGAFPFWLFTALFLIHTDKNRTIRFFSANMLANLVCICFFLLLPTTNTRPQIEGTGFWEWAMHTIYSIDSPVNLFPSIHCQLSWLCFQSVRNNPKVPKGWRVFSFVFALMIFTATLTTKQHVLADVLGGFLLAEVTYWLAGFPKVQKVYCRVCC